MNRFQYYVSRVEIFKNRSHVDRYERILFSKRKETEEKNEKMKTEKKTRNKKRKQKTKRPKTRRHNCAFHFSGKHSHASRGRTNAVFTFWEAHMCFSLFHKCFTRKHKTWKHICNFFSFSESTSLLLCSLGTCSEKKKESKK
jgi:hypothetical protein